VENSSERTIDRVVTLTCETCRAPLWAMGFCAVRKSFATLELAEHEARFVGWEETEAGWACSHCRGVLI